MSLKNLVVAFALFALVGLTVGCGNKTNCDGDKCVPTDKKTDCDGGKCKVVPFKCGTESDKAKVIVEPKTVPGLPGIKDAERIDPAK